MRSQLFKSKRRILQNTIQDFGNPIGDSGRKRRFTMRKRASSSSFPFSGWKDKAIYRRIIPATPNADRKSVDSFLPGRFFASVKEGWHKRWGTSDFFFGAEKTENHSGTDNGNRVFTGHSPDYQQCNELECNL